MPDFARVDFGRALWAFALSLALWLVVQAELNPERSDVFEVSVEPRNVPSGLVVTNQADWRPVQVLLAAPRDVFAQLRASQLHAYVELGRAGPGEAPFPVVVAPPDAQVRVGDPTPRQVVVRLEELTRKTLPVRARLDGNPPFGYRPGRPIVIPDTLVVTGPTSFVRRVEAAEVDVRLEAVTADIDTGLPANLLSGPGERIPSSAPGVELQPAVVRVQLPITQQVSYKEVGVHPLLRGSVPPGYWVQNVGVDPAVVTVIGEPQLLSGLDAIDTEVVELSGTTSSFTVPVTLQVPQGLALARAEPLNLTVQLAALPLRQTLRLPVTVQNVGSSMFLGSDVPIIEVTTIGPADRGLTPADVDASVDAAGLGPGPYVLEVRVRLPARYQLETVRPPSVPVLLMEASATVSIPTAVPPTPVPLTATSEPATPEPVPPPTAAPAPSPSATGAPPTPTASAARTPSATATRAAPTTTPSAQPAATPVARR
jgi:YbbR domain-containing protein